jgi:hypothetical protein
MGTEMALFFLTLGVMAIAMVLMGVGVILNGVCLRGSCGGPDAVGPDGEPMNCATCPNRRPEPVFPD